MWNWQSPMVYRLTTCALTEVRIWFLQTGSRGASLTLPAAEKYSRKIRCIHTCTHTCMCRHTHSLIYSHTPRPFGLLLVCCISFHGCHSSPSLSSLPFLPRCRTPRLFLTFCVVSLTGRPGVGERDNVCVWGEGGGGTKPVLTLQKMRGERCSVGGGKSSKATPNFNTTKSTTIL